MARKNFRSRDHLEKKIPDRGSRSCGSRDRDWDEANQAVVPSERKGSTGRRVSAKATGAGLGYFDFIAGAARLSDTFPTSGHAACLDGRVGV